VSKELSTWDKAVKAAECSVAGAVLVEKGEVLIFEVVEKSLPTDRLKPFIATITGEFDAQGIRIVTATD